MSGLLLAVGMAFAADGTYERLFPADDLGGSESVAAAPAEPTATLGGWRLIPPALLGALGLYAAWRLKRQQPKIADEARPIVVLGRESLGDRSALVLVEVVESDGERRRLLIGTGGSAPTLVADLGLRLTAGVLEEALAERDPSPEAQGH